MIYTLDADSITAILHKEDIIRKKCRYSILSGDTINISAISYYQIRRGLLFKDTQNQSKIFDNMCKRFDIILIDDISILDKASEIYARLKDSGKAGMGDCDILIASIACIEDFIVVTNNTRHFNLIKEVSPDLRIENWLN